jgi:hypothetical protein
LIVSERGKGVLERSLRRPCSDVGHRQEHFAFALGLIAYAANRRVLYTTSAEMLAGS